MDKYGFLFTLFGIAACVFATVFESDRAYMAVALAFVCAIGAVFWCIPTLSRGPLGGWPMRFPEPGPNGEIGIVNGMVFFWALTGAAAVLTVVCIWKDIGGWWLAVGLAASILSNARTAYAYSTYGLPICKARWLR